MRSFDQDNVQVKSFRSPSFPRVIVLMIDATNPLQKLVTLREVQ